MKHILLTFLIFIFSILMSSTANAQIDTINLATQDLIVNHLKPGKHQYLVTFGNSKKKKFTGSSVWNREVRYDRFNGEDVIIIQQQWYLSDTTFNRHIYSISRRKDFAPIFHKTKGKGGTEAFNFAEGKITGADTVENNARKDLNVTANRSTLNWELDLEIFSTLPYKKEGQRFIVSFYHPGGKTEPKYYEYALIGSEKIETTDGNKSDCWKLKIDYAPNSWAIFWIGKKSKEVLKMQEAFGNGFRYKVKLATPIDLTGL